VRRRGLGTASEIELEKSIRERDEQQAATAEVLKVISRSHPKIATQIATQPLSMRRD
jgi:hypothetical protein